MEDTQVTITKHETGFPLDDRGLMIKDEITKHEDEITNHQVDELCRRNVESPGVKAIFHISG